jgi:tetratricopeptide (TPR) repeat protein
VQKGRKREKAHAGRRSGGGRRRSTPVAEQTLFFNRLRAQAKWMFVLLALVFGVGFVVFGVGGGIPGSSLGDLFRGHSSSSGPSESDLRDQIAKNPNDAAAYKQLATILQQKHETKDAITELQQYTKLRPKDTTVLAELGSLYLTQGNQYQREAQKAQAEFAAANPGAFLPSLTASNGQPVLTDPITQPTTQEASTKFNEASANAQGAYTGAVNAFKRLAKLTPTDTTAQLNLGQAAETAGDLTTAIAAYKTVLKLAPTDPIAPQVRQHLKALRQEALQQAAQQAIQTNGR